MSTVEAKSRSSSTILFSFSAHIQTQARLQYLFHTQCFSAAPLHQATIMVPLTLVASSQQPSASFLNGFILSPPYFYIFPFSLESKLHGMACKYPRRPYTPFSPHFTLFTILQPHWPSSCTLSSFLPGYLHVLNPLPESHSP